MYKTLANIFFVGQLIFSVIVIVAGADYSLRCLLDGQLFCAVCFAIIGYVSGYLMLFRNSLKELRKHNAKCAKS